MRYDARHGKLVAKDGWLICPACGRGRVKRLMPTTRSKDDIVYCKVCGRESIVNINECLCQSACAT